MADKAWSGNIGEWGELYAACALLGAGTLSIAERPKPYKLLSLQRPEKHGAANYKIQGDQVFSSAPGSPLQRSEYFDAATKLREIIANKVSGTGAIVIPSELQRSIENLGFTKISAGSGATSDLHLEVQYPGDLDSVRLKGYSIKTEAGAAPTFYNMSDGRHLYYSITADPKALEALRKAIVPGGPGTKAAMSEFAISQPQIEPGTTQYPFGVASHNYASDLRGVDGDALMLIALSVLEYYFYGKTHCDAATDAVALKDPLGRMAPSVYRRKYVQVWREFSYGIGGQHYEWPGAEQGGILRVKSNMEIEAVPIARESSDHLLANTAFDMPSFPRWLTAKNLTALEITSPGKAVLILPWQIKWKAASSPK
jgi:hypothetical protein